MDQAQELASRHWGLISVAHELPSSIDQNFRLDTAGGSFVLKISNSTELPEYLAAQIRALEHLARTPGAVLRVPEVVHCSDGRSVVQAEEHPVWLVTWVDGMPIARLAARPPELLRAVGRVLGELDRRLTGFDDPAVHREFRWDLMQAPAILALTGNIEDSAGRDLVRRYAGERLNGVSKKLSKRGILTIITLRIVPVAPFVVINLVAGASHIRFRNFALGTLVGLLPGLIAIALFADGLVQSVRDPNIETFTWLAVVVLLVVMMMFGLRKWLGGKQGSADSQADN